MSENLYNVGISDPAQIDRYSLRQESGNDILKIYLKKKPGEFFAKSVKLKYPCTASGELDENLSKVLEELNHSKPTPIPRDLKKKILSDLRHLEKVVQSKINEIEADLERL
ncbi:DUF3461 family protein [Dongshaea marina]|uniref:DUF3461 family protein n=1 Tax=Dongshaea marina TaxID=2047966 RepID=UPI000D3E1222|nr:DUF3461 family protein [Dongshaea marina]